jgi:large subunit ribosomal protein L4
MRLPVYNVMGEVVGERELPEEVFGVEPNIGLMHQALVRQLANARLGTHSTKTRGEVSGGGRKPWRQKGTGRARHGSIRSPIWRGGGTVFGPKPRKYTQGMPRKMRRGALRSALSIKAAEQAVMLVDRLELPAPRTAELLRVLDRLELPRNTLILTAAKDAVLQLAARNLPDVKVLLARYLNVRDLMACERVLLPLDALEVLEEWLAPAPAGLQEAQA